MVASAQTIKYVVNDRIIPFLIVIVDMHSLSPSNFYHEMLQDKPLATYSLHHKRTCHLWSTTIVAHIVPCH